MMDVDDLALLPALEALLSETSVTRAARHMGLSQPAMSARLARLRALTGDALLAPTGQGRGLAPTPHALALRSRLEAALAAAQAVLRPAAAFDLAMVTTTLRIVTHDNAAALVAATTLARLQAAVAPHLRVALVRPDGRPLNAWLESGRADFAIAADDLRHEDAQLRRRLLLRDHFMTAQRKQHPRGRQPLHVDAFCGLDHLLVSAEGAFSGAVDHALDRLGRSRRVAFSVSSYTQAPLIVAGSDLVVTAPSRLLQPFTGLLDLFEPPLPMDPIGWQLLWHPRMQDDPANTWAREQLTAPIDADAAPGAGVNSSFRPSSDAPARD